MQAALKTPLYFPGLSFLLLQLELWRVSGVKWQAQGDLAIFQRRIENSTPYFSPELNSLRSELYGKWKKILMQFDVWCFPKLTTLNQLSHTGLPIFSSGLSALFILWPEFIKRSCSQRDQDGSDVIFWCRLLLHLWGEGCDMSTCTHGENSFSDFLLGRVSWHSFFTFPAMAASMSVWRGVFSVWRPLQGCILGWQLPPMFLGPTSQYPLLQLPAQSLPMALGAPGWISGSAHRRLILSPLPLCSSDLLGADIFHHCSKSWCKSLGLELRMMECHVWIWPISLELNFLTSFLSFLSIGLTLECP